MRFLMAVMAFMLSLTTTTIIWYVSMPLIDNALNILGGVSVTILASEQQSIYTNTTKLIRYGLTWFGILSIVSLIAWLFLYSFREESTSAYSQ